jgi:hypothetical protein
MLVQTFLQQRYAAFLHIAGANMKKITFIDKPARTHTATIAPPDDSACDDFPPVKLEIFDFADDEANVASTPLPGIAPWDAWLKQSQLTHH